MIANLIKTLLQNLPRYAEGEGDFYSVPHETLIDALCHQHPLDRTVAENTAVLMEALLDTLAVLQRFQSTLIIQYPKSEAFRRSGFA